VSASDDQFADAAKRAVGASDDDGDTYWQIVTGLQREGGPKMFRRAMALCAHADPRRRELGVDILAQLDHEAPRDERPSREATITFLADLMSTEPDPGVLRVCGSAFGHLGDHGNPESLVAHRVHPDERVREKVGVGIRASPTDDRALDALIELSRDPVARVREWPLFWFTDPEIAAVPRIRERLVDALDDPDLTGRAEATCGLAAVGQPGLAERIAEELRSAPDDADNYGRGRLRDARDLLDRPSV
jgi:hypothetical protein